MVSPISPMMGGATGTPVHNRGFIPEETVVAIGPGDTALTTYYRPFWRPVVAGTIVVLSLFTLSWYLMLGCHVGIDPNGFIVLGAGAAVWIWITACIAYFAGGFIASRMTMPSHSAWLKGAVLWALSVPLGLFLYGMLGQGAGLLAALQLPHLQFVESTGVGSAMEPHAHYGFFWSAFITLALGMVFSLVGSTAGCECESSVNRT